VNPVLVLVVALLVGAIPFSGMAAWRLRRVDLREYGSGTVSGTGLYRVAGFGPMAAAGILDVGKGAVGPLLAGHARPELAALAGGLAVVGHNWSPFLRGAGGRGFSPSLGVLLVLAWPGALMLLAVFLVGVAFRQAGLGMFVAMLALTPMLAALYGIHGVWTGLALAVPMFVKRLAGNQPAAAPRLRTYASRLVFDHDGGAREPAAPAPPAAAEGPTDPSPPPGPLDGYRSPCAPVDPWTGR
jgi:acyl phosphate:glycerol-3-phosphate acyltransferase